jgi:hypothetical protein
VLIARGEHTNQKARQMNKPFLWINTLSSVLHDSVNSVVSYELRSTAGDICNRNRRRQQGLRSAPQGANDSAKQADRQVA